MPCGWARFVPVQWRRVAEFEGLWVLTFRTERFRCAIRLDRVREIIPFAAGVKAPGQPSLVEGFLNLRGAVLPIVRVAALFDLPFAPGAWSPVIVLQNPGGPLGLLVDSVEDVLSIRGSGLRPVSPCQTLNECAEAEFSVEGRDYFLLDCDRLFLAEEQSRIGELQTRIARRLADLGALSP